MELMTIDVLQDDSDGLPMDDISVFILSRTVGIAAILVQQGRLYRYTRRKDDGQVDEYLPTVDSCL